LDVPLVVFDSVLDHILRIDRVLKQPLGHLLLVGASGVGKTTLTRFVSWINGLEVFQIKAGRNYSVYDFDEDLRKVMRAAGVERKKICFIFDESNVLGPAFLERMNALLAGGEVPGLFDGDDYHKLIFACKDEARKNNRMLETDDEIYRQFTKEVQRNLHVAFTMNPANADFSNRSASSPALFNRCVIDWFGDWADDGLLQVSQELTKFLDIKQSSFSRKVELPTIEDAS
jgi:dynein heavy chain 1